MTTWNFVTQNICVHLFMCDTLLILIMCAVSKAFQQYKELFNPMSFGPCNRLLKIRKSIWTPIPKVGEHKNPVKEWWPKPSHGTQKGKAKKRPKEAQLVGTKKKGKS
jgi:hypothetical protein